MNIFEALKEARNGATAGKWAEGKTTHETVAKVDGREDYRVAEFRHADDAMFCDLAHAHILSVLEMLTQAEARIKDLLKQDDGQAYKEAEKFLLKLEKLRNSECDVRSGKDHKKDEAEKDALRQVYENARGMLRHEGVDADRTLKYRLGLQDAINDVMIIDGGNWEPKKAPPFKELNDLVNKQVEAYKSHTPPEVIALCHWVSFPEEYAALSKE